MNESSIWMGTAAFIAAMGVAGLVAASRQIARVKALKDSVSSWRGTGFHELGTPCQTHLREAAARGDSLDIAGEVDEAVSSLGEQVGFPRFVAGAAVYVGLFGALMGLQAAVWKLGTIDQVKTPDQLDAFFQNSKAMLNSFGSAFYAAMAGVLVTVALQALLAVHGKQLEKLYIALEEKLRKEVLPGLPMPNQLGTAVDKLAQATHLLQLTIASADRTFASLDSRLNEVGQGVNAILEDSREALASTQELFLEAVMALGTTMQDGADALGSSAHSAASTIADAASSAAETMSENVRIASAGREALEAGVDKMGAALDGLQRTVSSSESYFDYLTKAESALADLTRQQKEFSGNVRHDLTEAMKPVVDELETLTAASEAAFRDLSYALEEHREFVIKLGESVATIPEATASQELLLVGRARIDELTGQVRAAQMNSQSLEQELHGLSRAITDTQPQAPQVYLSPDQVNQIAFQVKRALDAGQTGGKRPWWKLGRKS